ncbi:MAG: DUF262 domain-containing protein [Gammaproteobacteria bacterium]|nr:DUF262 domain-containing protein [Gammaproteobacteria bacterium]
MNFNTANQTFRQLLGNGLTYHVPPFQRDYSWAEDEWDDLWQDILGLFAEDGEPAHYLGYLVLQSADNRRFDIIDGQQRMTTLSLMMLAGMAYLEELVKAGLDAENNRRRKEQLQSSYIGYVDPVTLAPKSKLSLNRHNNRFYQTYLAPLEPLPQRGLNDSEQRLRRGFIWFKEHIQARFEAKPDGGQQFVAMIDSLVDRLFFTVITVTDELNAFKVFETLNARGVRLSATDLLKNYLFSLLSAADIHDLELRVLEERWEHIVGLLGSESFPEFLRVFWNSRNRLVRKAELFKTIRRHIGNREQAFALLRDLDNSADVYAALRDPGDASWHGPERAALRQLLMFNVRQPLAMLMACYHRFFNTDRTGLARILRAVAAISFRYNVICNLQTHEQERLYNGIARRVSEGAYAHPNEVISALAVVYPDDRQFKAAFSEKEMCTTNSRNKKVVRYILFEIERQRSERSFDVESAIYSLEHILPERAGEDWSHIDETRQERLLYRLGNMTLLEAHRNRDIGNASYEAKRENYRSSDFQLTRAVAEHYDTWDEQKIDARQQQLAKVASAVWRVEFGN